uniref:Uncharacterized protein n=1 Tax=uncultured prokaryote TaxID=198431 RepID=A0A0H5Q7X1_9ZZZZ|nr:hypothetical protein [uncultured prokaryote]
MKNPILNVVEYHLSRAETPDQIICWAVTIWLTNELHR